MGIFGAMTTAVSGLSAQAYALENISGNISNSQTTGFKRIDTSFVDMIPDGGPRRELAGSVSAYSRATNEVQGQLQAASINTNMAINGDGFFVVKPSTGTVDNRPIFTGANNYTRRGDFEMDRNGYLVNGAGYYLSGLRLDPATGNPVGSNPDVIRIENDVIPARQTSTITYRASLPTRPDTARADPNVPNSELIDPSLLIAGQPPATITGAAPVANFIETSVAGGSVSVYNAQGQPVNVQMRWSKLTNTAPETWAMYYQSDSRTGSEAWTRIGGNFTFDNQGKLTAPTTSPTITALAVNGVAVGDVTLNLASNSLTQFAQTSGFAEVTQIDQDGFTAGKLSNIAITENGRVRANYSNGRTIDIFSVPVANFQGDNMLKRMDGGVFAETSESGAPNYTNGGRVVGRSLEGSNVDISEEFTKLIVTQQAYAANTRIVSTANQMLQETINMIR